MNFGLCELTKEGFFSFSIFQKQKGRLILLEKFSSHERSAVDDFSRKIKNLAIKRWYLNITPEKVSVRELAVPFGDRQKIREVIPHLIENMILLEQDQIIFDFFVLTQTKEAVEVKVVFIEKILCDELCDKLQTMGIPLDVVTSLAVLNDSNGYQGKNINLEQMLYQEFTSPSINLLPPEYRYTSLPKKVKKNMSVCASLFIAVLIVSNLFIGLRTYRTKKEIAAYARSIDDIYQSYFPGQSVQSPLYQMRARVKALQEKRKFMQKVSPLGVLQKLSQCADLAFHFEEIKIKENIVYLHGQADSLTTVELVHQRLMNYFPHCTLEKTNMIEAGRILFVIQARVHNVSENRVNQRGVSL